jgi:hypothetical protein
VTTARARVLRGLPVSIVLVCCLAGCGGVSDREARALVDNYIRAVSEAYRRSDVTLVDGAVGPLEGKRLTGLIGVRQDMGISLDADALSVEVTEVEMSNEGELRVRTKESWRYRDRRIGTGEQVGAESLDRYEMLYVFRRIDGRWKVDETRFSAPPHVGRSVTPWGIEHGAMQSSSSPEKPRGGLK